MIHMHWYQFGLWMAAASFGGQMWSALTRWAIRRHVRRHHPDAPPW